ncbi:hypothetical protein FHS41_006960 [Streptomyces violarus]|uniref:Uncharacterized protein n=1 Tax=Streptomyces violarus TaxID=67380 RepID=A0A7W4ZXD8_9ACTN|nr:hypothetical protein [Streptomyces violarus]
MAGAAGASGGADGVHCAWYPPTGMFGTAVGEAGSAAGVSGRPCGCDTCGSKPPFIGSLGTAEGPSPEGAGGVKGVPGAGAGGVNGAPGAGGGAGGVKGAPGAGAGA